MAPTRLMIIRHAEKPTDEIGGVTASGQPDPDSLTPRGWQRAGALARMFHPAGDPALTPDVIFAAGVGPGSKSKRPSQTVTPLVELLQQSRPTPFITSHLKDELQPLITDALARAGVVLISWEHLRIPALVALIPQAPAVPQTWPDDRFDVIWTLDRTAAGWHFAQQPQLLLAGDQSSPIL
jgi:broad specificity phosphatase PhoE